MYFNTIEWFPYRSHMWRKEHEQVRSNFFVLNRRGILKGGTGIKVVPAKGINHCHRSRWVHSVIFLSIFLSRNFIIRWPWKFYCHFRWKNSSLWRIMGQTWRLDWSMNTSIRLSRGLLSLFWTSLTWVSSGLMLTQPQLEGKNTMIACTGAYQGSQIPGMTCS